MTLTPEEIIEKIEGLRKDAENDAHSALSALDCDDYDLGAEEFRSAFRKAEKASRLQRALDNREAE